MKYYTRTLNQSSSVYPTEHRPLRPLKVKTQLSHLSRDFPLLLRANSDDTQPSFIYVCPTCLHINFTLERSKLGIKLKKKNTSFDLTYSTKLWHLYKVLIHMRRSPGLSTRKLLILLGFSNRLLVSTLRLF